jgi:diketogulonate reductase-like aldo/keto reductase
MKRINGIPALGFGTYPLKGNDAYYAVRMAIDCGFRHIDTAQMYLNEPEVGRALKDCGVAREEFFITTKIHPNHLGSDKFLPSAEKSFENLGGAVDLLLIHWPPPDEELESTIDRLALAKQTGLTKNIGVSNFTPRMLRNAFARTGGEIICNQVEFHPLHDQTELLKTAGALGVVLEAFSPLARGAALWPDAVQEISLRLERPASEIVLRWIIQQGVIPIPMTSKEGNAKSNLRALEFELSQQDMNAISKIGTRDGRIVNTPYMDGRWDS